MKVCGFWGSRLNTSVNLLRVGRLRNHSRSGCTTRRRIACSPRELVTTTLPVVAPTGTPTLIPDSEVTRSKLLEPLAEFEPKNSYPVLVIDNFGEVGGS